MGGDETGTDGRSLLFAFQKADKFFYFVPGSPPDDQVTAQARRLGSFRAGQGSGVDRGWFQAVFGLGHDQLADLEVLDAGDGGKKLVSRPELESIAGFRCVVLVFMPQLFRGCFRSFVHALRSNSQLAGKLSNCPAAPHLAAIGPAHVLEYASPSRLPQPAALLNSYWIVLKIANVHDLQSWRLIIRSRKQSYTIKAGQRKALRTRRWGCSCGPVVFGPCPAGAAYLRAGPWTNGGKRPGKWG